MTRVMSAIAAVSLIGGIAATKTTTTDVAASTKMIAIKAEKPKGDKDKMRFKMSILMDENALEAIKNSDKLTQDEKDKIAEAYQKAQPLFEQMEKIQKEISENLDPVSELVEKSGVIQPFRRMPDIAKLKEEIQASEKLTQEEKEKVLSVYAEVEDILNKNAELMKNQANTDNQKDSDDTKEEIIKNFELVSQKMDSIKELIQKAEIDLNVTVVSATEGDNGQVVIMNNEK